MTNKIYKIQFWNKFGEKNKLFNESFHEKTHMKEFVPTMYTLCVSILIRIQKQMRKTVCIK